MGIGEIVSIVISACSLLGTVIGFFATIKLLGYRVEQLEKKQDKHNSVIERVYHLEQENEVNKEKIKVINHRIGDLERP